MTSMMMKKRRESGKLTDVMHAKESPEARLARKQAEYAEEEEDAYHEHPKPPAEKSMLARIGQAVSQAAGAVGGAGRPWAKLMGDDDEEQR